MVGDRIKQARISLGYSAEQVAAFLNVSPATVYRYENGDISKLPSKFIKPLAEFLCVTPGYLMEWADDRVPDPPPDIRTPEARSLAKGIDKMPEEQRKAIMTMMTALYPGIFEKGTENDDT